MAPFIIFDIISLIAVTLTLKPNPNPENLTLHHCVHALAITQVTQHSMARAASYASLVIQELKRKLPESIAANGFIKGDKSVFLQKCSTDKPTKYIFSLQEVFRTGKNSAQIKTPPNCQNCKFAKIRPQPNVKRYTVCVANLLLFGLLHNRSLLGLRNCEGPHPSTFVLK